MSLFFRSRNEVRPVSDDSTVPDRSHPVALFNIPYSME